MILIETKNIVIANDVAIKIDLIKNKKIKVKKISVSINITVDNEINLNKFKKNKTIDDIWKTWTCKTNKINKFVFAMFIDKNLLIESQYY